VGRAVNAMSAWADGPPPNQGGHTDGMERRLKPDFMTKLFSGENRTEASDIISPLAFDFPGRFT
jgi:hypothetical protein